MEEVPVATAKANVMFYDGASKSWMASGPDNGVSKVQLYRNELTNAYRIVGWRLQDREVVINCALIRGLEYNEARPTFHQWRDSKNQVYGLNFISADEAAAFASAVRTALAVVQQQQQQSKPPQPLNKHQQQQQPQQATGWTYQASNTAPVFSDSGRSSTALQSLGGCGDAVTVSDRVSPMASLPYQQAGLSGEYQYPTTNGSYSGRTGQNNIGSVGECTYAGSQASDSRFYSSSDDSVKGLVVGPGVVVGTTNGPVGDLAAGIGAMKMRSVDGSCHSNTAPSGPVAVAPVLPPPPVLKSMQPPNGVGGQRHSVTTAPSSLLPGNPDGDEEVADGEEGDSSGLAAQLQQALKQKRLRAASLAPAPASAHSASGSNQSGAGTGTLGREAPRGSVDMLSDLRQVLAARRRAQETGGNESGNGRTAGAAAGTVSNGDTSGYSRVNPATSHVASESVSCFATLRKNPSPALDSGMGPPPPPPPPFPPTTVITSTPSNCQTARDSLLSRADLEQFKRELLSEFRREVQQLKSDVVEALRTVVSQQ